MARRLPAASAAAVLLATVADGCGSPDSDSPPTPSRAMRLASCEMTVDVFPVPVAAVRRHVTARYELLAYGRADRAAIDVWVLDCRGVPLGARAARRPAALALVGAVVAGPRRGRPVEAPSPKDYQHYLLAAHTNRPELAASLRRAGLAAETVRGLRSSRVGRRRVTEVASRASPLVVSAPLSGARDRPHDHFNVWWHDGRDGRTSALELRADGANDRYCRARLCGTITTTRPSRLARLLGARSRRAHVSLRHLPLDPTLRLTTLGCRAVSTPCRAR